MKTYNLIWQGYLLMGIDRVKMNQIFSTQQCYEYMQKLDTQKKIRFSSCYEQKKVCKSEIEAFLGRILEEINCLARLSDGKWKKIKN